MKVTGMEFGVFDHLDGYGGGGSLADYYEDRLRITQAYDRAGFYGYHVAEHHSTRLGMAPSPSVSIISAAGGWNSGSAAAPSRPKSNTTAATPRKRRKSIPKPSSWCSQA